MPSSASRWDFSKPRKSGRVAKAPLAPRSLGPFGAEIDHDLTVPLGEDGQAELARLLFQHGILVFRDQALSDGDQSRVMSYLGPVLQEEGGHREISVEGNLGRERLLFHSDLAFTPEPFKLLSLYGIDVENGTATLFASAANAFATLPAALRSRVEGLDAITVLPPSQGERLVRYDTPEHVPQITRPAILPHPTTSEPLLFLSEQQTARLVGLAREDSDALLAALFAHLYAPANVYRHDWRAGDFVVWDNLALQHARSPQTKVTRRRLRRIAVAEKTFFQLCPQFAPDDARIAAWGVGGVLDLVPN